MVTTIQVTESTKEKLESFKHAKRETYDEVIRDLIEMAEEDKMELSDETKRRIRIAREEIRRGKGISHSAVKRELGL